MVRRRISQGSTAAELPIGILFLFVFLLLPLINLGTFALRTSMVYLAANSAVQIARRAETFKNNPRNASGNSAVQAARLAASGVRQNGLGGVRFDDSDIIVKIIGIPTKENTAAI